MPLLSWFWPVPSRLMRTLMRVSAVLRLTSAMRGAPGVEGMRAEEVISKLPVRQA
ncbi:hypothetical protein D3C71_2111450 [compost metagenome]